MTKLHLSAVAAATAAADQDAASGSQPSHPDSSQFHEHIDTAPPPNAALRLALARAVERRGSTKTD
ncbi:hypothetical protein AB4Y45_35205 [Paraburkholderia sp. EG287A]|uniref:hypothetical protein n=1 Tax=Paraburkholderia sp. EG287A TaxID=3237012 RepID=UPI0034D27B78